MKIKKRLDVLLMERGFADSRTKAQAIIMSGLVYVTGQKADKPGTSFDETVDIAVQVNLKGVCKIGEGRLVHNLDGFHLQSADGALDYKQSAVYSHTVYSDYYWYEIGDVVGIGDNEFSYFCFPKSNASVTKVRLAAEELYKIKRVRRRPSAAKAPSEG